MPEIYGVRFGDKHSWNDWGVYLDDSELSLESPAPRKILIDVPFRNGLLDATLAVSNRIFYEARNISFCFKVGGNSKKWPDLYSTILGDVHGRSLHIVRDTDPDYYWDAYDCEVDTPSSQEGIGRFSISCQCYPYKLKNDLTIVRKSISGSGIEVTCKNSRMEASPIISTTAAVQMTYIDEYGISRTVLLNDGDNSFDDLIFVEGNNILTFSNVINLISYPYYRADTYTHNGITYTVNDDLSVTANGTATANSNYFFRSRTENANKLFLPEGTYTLSGCPSGGGTSTYRLRVNETYNDAARGVANDSGNGATFTVDAEHTECQKGVYIEIYPGTTVNNLVFKPMLNSDAEITISYREGVL